METCTLKFMLLLSVAFISLLRYTEAAYEVCDKCPDKFKWSEKQDCNSYCHPEYCKMAPRPGCVCADDNLVNMYTLCIPPKDCDLIAIDQPQCAVGAGHMLECIRCEHYCPGHFPGKNCGCSPCIWGCKCYDKNQVIDTKTGKCVDIKECTSITKQV